MDNTIKFGQINLGKGQEATANCQLLCNWDILLVQEPYTLRNGSPTHGWTNHDCFFDTVSCSDVRIRSMIVIRKSFCSVTVLSQWTTRDFVAVRCSFQDQDLVICSIYLDRLLDPNVILDSIDKICQREARVIIGGDFNAKSLLWGPDLPVHNTQETERGELVEDFILRSDLQVANDPTSPPTFQTTRGKAWIDVSVTKGVAVTQWMVSDIESLSDHSFIFFSVQKPCVEEVRKRRFNHRKADWKIFQRHLATYRPISHDLDFDAALIEDMANDFNNCIIKACEESMLTPASRVSKPWWNFELWQLKKEVRRKRRKFQEARGCERDIKKTDYKNKRREYKHAIRKARIQSWHDFCELESKKDPFSLPYKILARKTRNQSTLHTVKKKDDTWTNDEPETSAFLLREYFPMDNLEEEEELHISIRDKLREPYFALDDREFTVNELKNAISRMNVDSAPGPDGVPAATLPHIFEILKDSWLLLLNLCLRFGVFPSCWKKAQVVLLPKTDSKYRPICLLSVVGKILDRLCADRLTFHLEHQSLFSPLQFGYRAQRDSIKAVKHYVERVKGLHENGKHCLAVALDITNAFNCAWYPKILAELRRLNVPKNLLSLIQGFLSDRSVQLGSQKLVTERGCPQGSCLGPIIWLVVMEELLGKINALQDEDIEGQAVADDTLVTLGTTSVAKIEDLWKLADNVLMLWARENKLTFNPDKTAALFHPSRYILKTNINGNYLRRSTLHTRVPNIVFCGRTIKPTGSFKYLGFEIDSSFLWERHFQYLKTKVVPIAKQVRIVAAKSWGIPASVLRTIYLRCFLPMLLYGAEVWGHRATKIKPKKLLDSACRPLLLLVTKAYRTVANDSLFVLAGIIPCSVIAHQRYLHSLRIADPTFENKLSPTHFPHPSERVSGEVLVHDPDCCAEYCVYTDGSKTAEGTGCGFVVLCNENEIFSENCHLDSKNSVFQAEVQALIMAFRYAIDHLTNCLILDFYSDSRAALSAITGSTPSTSQVEMARHLYGSLRSSKLVTLAWVKSHVGIKGNEIADNLAKSGIQLPDVHPLPTPVSFSKCRLKTDAILEWQLCWDNTDKGRPLHPFLPKVSVAENFLSHKVVQVITGHGNFGEYLHRIRKSPSPSCNCGFSLEDPKHILQFCDLPFRAMARASFLKDVVPKGFSWGCPESCLKLFREEFCKFCNAVILDHDL